MMRIIFFLTGFLMLFLLGSCKKGDQEAPADPIQTPYTIIIPTYFPTLLNIPEDNPMTVEGVELGRRLFYDGRLSGRTHPDSLMTCATCHLQEHAFECGINHPKFQHGHPMGLTGIQTPHFMMPLFNLVWNHQGYLWNGFVGPLNADPMKQQLEDLVWMGIVAPHEMAGDTTRTRQLLESIPDYPEMFRKAFGTPEITIRKAGKAIAQFIRTLISANSKFDRYLRGEVQLSDNELNGYVLFMTEQGGDCFHCHGGSGNPLFTTNFFYNNAKDSLFTGIFEDPRDRYHVTGDPMDVGAYRAPSLRNLAFTAPYMHDGRFQTLDEVLTFYNSGLVWSPYAHPLMHHLTNGGVRLSPTELTDLKAFLLTLSDSSFIINPEFGPAAIP